MTGRSGCLLLSVLFLSSLSSLGQDARLARLAPRLPVDPPSARLPVRIVLPRRAPITPPGVIGFPALSRAAGMIFSGTVTEIERRPARRGQSVETVAVTFHIESALRGATAGAESHYQSVDWLVVFRAAICLGRARSLISISEEQVGTDQLCGRSARAF